LLLFAAADRKPIGIIALRDELRDDSRETVHRLRQLGVRSVLMLTGDRKSRADALAENLGIDQVFAELRPEEKADILKKLRDGARRIAYVGDGVNDAPALVTADVGIAMPLGADIARATADIMLLEERFAALADARDASRKAMEIIRGNYRAAIGINTALFLGASAGLLPPIAAAVLHNGTTLALLSRALSANTFPRSYANAGSRDRPAAQGLSTFP